ncbi:MAG TPA: MBOAT family O-acyltransferase [Ferruginibacter sp.]|nr:MBOAT family O-acyltransferase [Ferruginibacter sp.]
MLFNSFHFVFFFLIVTGGYFSIPYTKRWMWLLAASCYFYMAFVPVYILILAFTIIIDYFAGIYIERSEGKRRKLFLVSSLVANIGILCFFKYFNFFNDNISAMLGIFEFQNPVGNLSILLPIGLSFHTFQAMSYTIEVYRGNQQAERHFGIYALYVMFYPQLVAGPIERPQNLLHQFRQKIDFDGSRVFSGLKLMLWGLFKKIVVADRLGIFVDNAYNYHAQQSGAALALATIFFSFQVYCDFSAYSDIARGSARVMGFDLMKNFNRPNLSRSTAEFWKRWHISLSTWFKDYLYFPLGGNRVPMPRRYVNLMIVFLISGFWHGANWTFVIWGGINGLFLVMGLLFKKQADAFWKFTRLQKFPILYAAIHISITFLLISFSRIFFRSQTVEQAFAVIKKIFSFSGSIFKESAVMMLYSFFAIAFLMLVEMRNEYKLPAFTFSLRRSFWVRSTWYALLVILILLVGVYDGGQFIYFQF